MKKLEENASRITIIFGVLLFLAPFISIYNEQSGPTWACIVSGAGIIVLGVLKYYRWASLFGLAAILAPWVLGFAGTTPAIWMWVIGGATHLLTGYQGFIAEQRDRTVGHPPHHA